MNTAYNSDTKGLINQACKHKFSEIMCLCNEMHRVIKSSSVMVLANQYSVKWPEYSANAETLFHGCVVLG